MATIIQDFVEQYPSREYSDVNIAFTRHPISKDVSIKTNDDSIKQSLRNLVLLNKFEKPFHPNIGGGIYQMLFENMDVPGTVQQVKYDLSAMIEEYEPRVDLTGVDVVANYDSNSVTISIYYVIINTLEPSNVDIFLKFFR